MLLKDRILFIDAEAIIIDKPAGLPVDPPRDASLSVESHLDSLKFGFARRPVAVHRLDRDTSGCLLLARNPKVLVRFQRAFEAREAVKHYLAVVDGVPNEGSGVIDMPLSKHSTAKDGWRMVHDPKGKAAVTRWEIVAEHEGRALVRFTPETGRTHQLRVHAASGLGLPIVGDPVYGRAAEPMLLHAAFLSVPRPTKPPVEAEAPLPASFDAYSGRKSGTERYLSPVS